MPAVASWNAAMPPAAPVPTTITSHLPVFGVMAVESLRDSLVMAYRSTVMVRSACIEFSAFCPQCGQSLPSSVAHPTNSGSIWLPLVPQLLVDADLGGVVAVDGGLFGGLKKRSSGVTRLQLVPADVGHQRVHGRGSEPRERRAGACRFGVDRGKPFEPLLLQFLRLAEQQVDVVGDPRLLRARRTLVGRDDGFDERLQGRETRRRHDLGAGRRVAALHLHEGKQSCV